MVQQDEQTQQALSYMRHQGAKSIADLAALMERTAFDCARCLEGISEEQASFKPALSRSPERSEGVAEGAGEEWSVKEVLGHMLVSGAGVNREVANLVAGQPPVQEARMGVVAGADRPIDELRRRLAELWAETARLVATLPEEGSVERTWEHPLFGPLNSKEWIAFQRIHALDHVQQIEQIKAAPSYPKS